MNHLFRIQLVAAISRAKLAYSGPELHYVLALQQSHREIKYRNNIVEQDYRAIKRVVRPMLSLAS